MDHNRLAFASAGTQSRQSVQEAVRRALRSRAAMVLGTTLVAASTTATSAAVSAAPFPAELELSSLLPETGGNGSDGFVLPGVGAGDDSGVSVSSAGDLNGDGLADLVIGAQDASPGGRNSAGQTYVVFGRDTAQVGRFPAVIPLASLLPSGGGDGSIGFVLNGIDRYDESGGSVDAAGDVNGDGIGDLIIGAALADRPDRAKTGQAYIVFGRDTALAEGFPAAFPLASLREPGNTDGFVMNGLLSGDYSAFEVSAAGDVNSDGIGDVIVGARRADLADTRRDGGRSFVVFGRSTPFPAVWGLARLLPTQGGDGSEGFVLNGIRSSDFSGTSVSAAGDVNGDGVDDLIVGAHGADNGPDRAQSGQSYVVFGRKTAEASPFPAALPLASLLPPLGDGSAGFVLARFENGESSGNPVSAAGDVNNDGVDDLLIGALWADDGGRGAVGRAYVVFGRNAARDGPFPPLFQLASLLRSHGGDGSAGFVLTGVGEGDKAGVGLGPAGDVNGDGIDDLVIGAHEADSGGRGNVGQSYVVYGRDAAQGQGFPAVLPLSSLLASEGGDGTAGFVLNGIDLGDRSGHSVNSAGDVNGDGIDDLIIGAFDADPGGRGAAGESYVVFGRSVDERR